MRTKINQQNAQINPELICAFCWFIFVLIKVKVAVKQAMKAKRGLEV